MQNPSCISSSKTMTRTSKTQRKKMYSSCHSRSTRAISETSWIGTYNNLRTRSRDSRAWSKIWLKIWRPRKQCRNRRRRQEMMSNITRMTEQGMSDNRSRITRASWRICLKSTQGIRCWAKALVLLLSRPEQVIITQIQEVAAILFKETKTHQKALRWPKTTPCEVRESDSKSNMTKLW